ncbi:MAG: MFS transporter [Deltaproteobacteria bacterium]|jgi:predicted MFS family arabinose efflux permease|nr:MFS transporter [Deltaproteobacteria bacterium]
MSEANPQAARNSGAGASNRETVKLSLAAGMYWALALLGMYAQPQLLESVMADHGALEGAVGQLFAFENGAFFITLLLASGPIARLSRSRTALVGILVLIGGNLISAYAGSLEVLLVSRTITGIGAGLISGAATAAAASSDQPERVFAVITVLHNLVLSAEFKIIPYVQTESDPTGCYFMMAAIGVVSLPLCRWLIPPRISGSSDESLVLLLLSAPNRMLAMIVMAGVFVFEAGQSGVFTFVDQIGIQAGLNADDRGTVLSVTSLMGLSGGVVAAWLGVRVGRVLPISIGLSLNVAAAVGLAASESVFAFSAFNLLWGLAYNFLSPYLMGALAALDDRGRWAVAGESLWNGGTVPGPWIAGLLVERAGMLPLAGWALFTGGVCLVLVTAALRGFESRCASANSV